MTEPHPFTPLLDAYFAAYGLHDAKGCADAFTKDARLSAQFGPVVQGRRPDKGRKIHALSLTMLDC